MRYCFKFLVIAICCLTLSACGPKPRGEHEIYVGTIAGPETDLMQVAAKVAAEKFGLKIKVIEFEDYVLPNAALDDGSIDANMFQHQPYLNATIEARGFQLVAIANSFIYPMGLYSQKFNSLADIPQAAQVAIPNDPSNGARALLLLQEQGLIKLSKPEAGQSISIANIATNPKELRFIELDAAQLPRSLQDVALAAINTNYAIPAGLLPKRDALVTENKDSPYANILVVRFNEKDQEKYAQLVTAIHSPEVVAKAEELFAGQAIIAW